MVSVAIKSGYIDSVAKALEEISEKDDKLEYTIHILDSMSFIDIWGKETSGALDIMIGHLSIWLGKSTLVIPKDAIKILWC